LSDWQSTNVRILATQPNCKETVERIAWPGGGDEREGFEARRALNLRSTSTTAIRTTQLRLIVRSGKPGPRAIPARAIPVEIGDTERVLSPSPSDREAIV
jgi:hypothetical protein